MFDLDAMAEADARLREIAGEPAAANGRPVPPPAAARCPYHAANHAGEGRADAG